MNYPIALSSPIEYFGCKTMTAKLSQRDRGHLATHLSILGCIVVLSALLRVFPAAALAYGPSCVFHTIFHLNCPFCGMTRDFVDILHAQKPHLNPFSGVAAVVIYLVYPSVFLWAWSQQRLALFYQPAMHRLVATVLLVMFVVNNLPR
jgi:hypothetical protein